MTITHDRSQRKGCIVGFCRGHGEDWSAILVRFYRREMRRKVMATTNLAKKKSNSNLKRVRDEVIVDMEDRGRV